MLHWYAVTTMLLAKHLTELIKVSIFSAPQAKKNGGMNKAPQAIQCACGTIFLLVTRRNAIFCAPFAALERAVAHRRVDSVLCSTSCFSCSALLSSLCRSPRVACRRASARASRPLTRAIARCSSKYEPAVLRKPLLCFADQHGRKRDPSFFSSPPPHSGAAGFEK